MMERRSASRRRILRYGGVLATVGAAGCLDDESDRKTDADGGESGPNDTDPQTEPPGDAEAIAAVYEDARTADA